MAIIMPSSALHNVSFEQVEERLLEEVKEFKKKKLGYMEQQVIDPIKDQLLDLCRACPEFADIILADSKKTFEGCVKAALEDVKRDCSDDAVYTRAAQYYAPGCALKHTRKIILHPSEEKEFSSKSVSWLDFV